MQSTTGESMTLLEGGGPAVLPQLEPPSPSGHQVVCRETSCLERFFSLIQPTKERTGGHPEADMFVVC